MPQLCGIYKGMNTDWKRTRILLTGLLLLLLTKAFAQRNVEHQRLDIEIPDTFSLHRIFAGGHFGGHIRQFTMLTDNAPGLTDYYALAAGAALHYETRPWHGFRLAMGGEFVTDLASSDFTKPDPVTGAYDRYDAGLYEVLELDNKEFLARLEDLNVQYGWRQNRLILGKQILKTPLANPQDGRMNISMFEGIYGYFEPRKNLHLEGGWLWKSAPRSVNRWFETEKSVGLYPQGVATNGEKSDYAGNISSAGLVMFNACLKNKAGVFDFWNYYFENVLNTAFFQWTKSANLDQNEQPNRLHFGTQIIRQDALNNGGNANPALAYVDKNSKSWVFGGFAAWSHAGSRLQLNATRITADGRFLFPREWGREPLFTFLQRERNEGLGDVWAFSGQFTRQYARFPLEWSVGAGYYRLPDVKNYRLNKYGLPSYSQLNIEARYRFKGRLEGLDARVLAVWKRNAGNLHDEERYRINKVDMANYNVIFNYLF